KIHSSALEGISSTRLASMGRIGGCNGSGTVFGCNQTAMGEGESRGGGSDESPLDWLLRAACLVLLFVAIAVVSVSVVDRRLRSHGDCVERRGVHFCATKVRCFDANVLDRRRRNFARSFART